MYNLLTDQLFRVLLPGRQYADLSLPQVLAKLATGNIASFERLQSHQEPGWYMFLAQLGTLTASAAESAGYEPPDSSPDTWREMLLLLTGGDDTPWHLVSDDASRPAFMQPPTPVVFRREADTPDHNAIDIRSTSKMHDVKPGSMRHASPDHWIYALVCLQTMQGYSGRGNYGIIRMKSGIGSRPFVHPHTPWYGRMFRYDVNRLLSMRGSTIEQYGYQRNGIALLWLEPWNGKQQLHLGQLDPYFIEVCRLVRLSRRESGGIYARYAPSFTARIAGPDTGDVGDPWAPIMGDGGMLTVGSAGFPYWRGAEVLFGEWFAR